METKIKELIVTKIKEHVTEVEAAVLETEKRQKTLKNKDITTAREILVLKDKLLFHKACAMVLQDLLREINEIHNPKN